MRLSSSSPEDTRIIGAAVGGLLEKGDVVALVGRLGSGKTVFTQGLAQGLDVEQDEYVSSPSFALVNQYRARVPIFHVDTYRLQGESEMVALGYEEYFDPNGVTIIEWADKVRALLPERHVLVEFSILGPASREIDIRLVGSWPPKTQTDLMQVLKEYQKI